MLERANCCACGDAVRSDGSKNASWWMSLPLEECFFRKTRAVILRGMSPRRRLIHARTQRLIAFLFVSFLLLFAGHFYVYGQDKSGFPDGYDAVQAAPNSHKVIFENAFVRVLEVSLAPGTTEPYHHHRWPSFFIGYDTGGRTPHIRYHRPDGTVRDTPSTVEPTVSGHWTVDWMEPEPMHAVENADTPGSDPEFAKRPPWIRIEIKCHQ